MNEGFALPIGFIGGLLFYWFCLKIGNLLDNINSCFDKVYSTPSSSRIIGITEELIIDGKWTYQIKSLWKCHKTDAFFFVVVNELHPSKLTKSCTNDQARSFVVKYASAELCNKLIDDWFYKTVVKKGKIVSCEGCE